MRNLDIVLDTIVCEIEWLIAGRGASYGSHGHLTSVRWHLPNDHVEWRRHDAASADCDMFFWGGVMRSIWRSIAHLHYLLPACYVHHERNVKLPQSVALHCMPGLGAAVPLTNELADFGSDEGVQCHGMAAAVFDRAAAAAVCHYARLTGRRTVR